MSVVTIDDVKNAGALLFINNAVGHHKQVADDDIQKIIDEVEDQTVLWLSSNGIVFNENYKMNYNTKRLIVLETLINIAISYNISNTKDYITTLKEERDSFKKGLEENMPRFTSKAKHISPPKLKDGKVFY